MIASFLLIIFRIPGFMILAVVPLPSVRESLPESASLFLAIWMATEIIRDAILQVKGRDNG